MGLCGLFCGGVCVRWGGCGSVWGVCVFFGVFVQIKKNFLAKIGKNILSSAVIKFMLLLGDETG